MDGIPGRNREVPTSGRAYNKYVSDNDRVQLVFSGLPGGVVGCWVFSLKECGGFWPC